MNDKTSKPAATLPLPVSRALRRMGEDLALARRRRGISTASMAERAGITPGTLRRLERGDPGVALGTYTRVLHVLDLLNEINRALDTRNDALGLALQDQAVPKRIRRRKVTPDTGAL